MSTEEQVVTLVVAGNPVPDPDLLEPLELDYLDPASGWDGVAYIPLERSTKVRRVSPRLALLGAVTTMFAIVGLVVWFNRDRGPADQASPGEVLGSGAGTVLLAPPTGDGGDVIFYAADGRSAGGFVRGAVRTASGEIIGITIHGLDNRTGPGVGGVTTIGGQDVGFGGWAGDIYAAYDLWGDCFGATITTSEGLATEAVVNPSFPADIQTFFGQLTITGETVTVQLPPGWESLGAAASSERYTMRFIASTPAVATIPEFQLEQRPNTGVGVFLADPRSTNPRPTTLSGRPAWLITGSGGWITLIFDHDGTAVSLGARGMTDDQLVAFAATLVPQPWSYTLAVVDNRSVTQRPVDEQLPDQAPPLPQDCDVSLELG